MNTEFNWEQDEGVNQSIPSLEEELNQKKSPTFKLNSQHLHHAFLFLTIMIPFFFVALMYGRAVGVAKSKELFGISAILMSVGFFIALSLIKNREKKIKLSLEILIEERIRELEKAPPFANPMLTVKPLTNLKELEELKLQHEHHVNLLQSSMAKNKEKVLELSFELERKEEEISLLKGDLEKSLETLQEQTTKFHAHFQEFKEAEKHKDSLIQEYQETIKEQRKVIEKKQRTIVKLESKVHDLMYEIRSLLQLEESTPAFSKTLKNSELSFIENYRPSETVQISSPGNYDLSLCLKKYIKMAETQVGLTHLGYIGGKTPRFLDLTLEHSPLDVRSLFEKFKFENGIIALVDFNEPKILFANTAVKDLLGFSQEKFLKEFFDLCSFPSDEWKNLSKKVSAEKELFLKMDLKNKNGEIITLKTHIGYISQGPYTGFSLMLLSS